MKHLILFITSATIAIALLFACSNSGKEVERTTLLTENLAADHPDWQVSNDTIVKDFVLKLEFKPKTEIPFRLMWTIAADTAGEAHIAFYQFDRMGGTDRAEVNAKINKLGWSGNAAALFSITADIKPAQHAKGTIWQGFWLDFSNKGTVSAVGIEEVDKSLNAE